MEKYVPKSQGKSANSTKPKTNNDSNQKPDFDINVGLSERPPCFCSLCNTNATSKQALQLHAEGKKHRAKTRAYHAAKQQPKQSEETSNGSAGNNENNEMSENRQTEQNPSKAATTNNISVAENGDLQASKKRKLVAAENTGARKKAGGDTCTGLGNGEAIQIEKAGTGKKNHQVKKAKHNEDKDHKAVDSSSDKEDKKNIKWKKLITSALKSNPEGTLKFKKLIKLLVKSLKESGYTEDENQVTMALEQKINSRSRFSVDGKYVRLATKS